MMIFRPPFWRRAYFLSVMLLFSFCLSSQTFPDSLSSKVGEYLTEIAKKECAVGKIVIDSARVRGKRVTLYAGVNCSYIPFREETVASIYRDLAAMMPKEWRHHRWQLSTNGEAIEALVPFAVRSKKDRQVRSFKGSRTPPLITRVEPPFRATQGLDRRHLALWPSHGYYYSAKRHRWEWQRARIFQTVEDLYTASYLLPYVVPMLEHAGATVLLPRERDLSSHELIVDNDAGLNDLSRYREHDGAKRWSTGEQSGFAYLRAAYIDDENPFKEGSFRLVETIKQGEESLAEWQIEMPEAGSYAVYVAYQSLPHSADDALYAIYHQGGVTQLKVNQQMGGGTWICLGEYPFDQKKGRYKVVLSNRSRRRGRLVTADAVKVGGGVGNVARRAAEEEHSYAPYAISGYPRFTEGARYWMQWAGIPDSIYSESQGGNDYTDDYKSRGLWVNYLSGGSMVNPAERGLGIPIDLALAFHSDAGTTTDDSIIGTLGIFCTLDHEGLFPDGTSRYASRDLTDLIQTTIVHDIRQLYEPSWTRRGMWNRSYFEARVPKVPTMLLELLSHQNFADMRYGLDPRFRFTVSRSIYKGILQFLARRDGVPYVVQPLPVDHASIRFVDDRAVELRWEPVEDPLEPTATPTQYIVYRSVGAGAFDQGVVVDKNSYRTTIPSDVVCRFKITAINKGGESFPSEILAVGRKTGARGTVLVVNGFDRISAPADFVAPADSLAGFLTAHDGGVPYLYDLAFIGPMKEFRRPLPWRDNDASGFGDSHGHYETVVVAGNTFDYPALHGAAILQAGYSFTSCSDEAVERGEVRLHDYPLVDLILGKERQTKMGPGGLRPTEFKTFTPRMQAAITTFCEAGGGILVSGAYVGSDLWENAHVAPKLEDHRFAKEVLKYSWRVGEAAVTGRVKSVPSPWMEESGNYHYHHALNSEGYAVESPDAIEPATSEAHTMMRYAENNLSAAIAYRGTNYRTWVMGFPFEAIRSAEERQRLMANVLTFLDLHAAVKAPSFKQSHAPSPAEKIKVKTGIEVLKAEQFKSLEGKRVGLITNPTGVDHHLRSTIDVLHEAPQVNLVALYGPEHGVRGDLHAGAKVDHAVDSITGLPIFSLYGATRKPTAEMLKEVDLLIYDIQDIGCRSFTYISTMGLVMEAAAEYGKEVMVLDRPNPLGGLKVEGNVVEEGFVSFVSQYKIPYLYGLTCGELALYLNREVMGQRPCKLHVVKMEGWQRQMVYEQTGLQWIAPSPHIPDARTAFFYPTSGILGELGYLSIGVGYTLPFQLFAAPWVKAKELADYLNDLKLPGLFFRPLYLRPFYAVGKGEQLQGVQLHILDDQQAVLSEVQFYVMQAIAALYPDRAVFEHSDTTRFNMFDKVCGSDQIRKRLMQRNRWSDVRDYWNKDVAAFREQSKKYYLYR